MTTPPQCDRKVQISLKSQGISAHIAKIQQQIDGGCTKPSRHADLFLQNGYKKDTEYTLQSQRFLPSLETHGLSMFSDLFSLRVT